MPESIAPAPDEQVAIRTIRRQIFAGPYSITCNLAFDDYETDKLAAKRRVPING
jgi:hypothetical protein